MFEGGVLDTSQPISVIFLTSRQVKVTQEDNFKEGSLDKSLPTRKMVRTREKNQIKSDTFLNMEKYGIIIIKY